MKGQCNMTRLLNFAELRTKLGHRSRSACYNDLAAQRLPQPIRLGGRLYWLESDLEAHLAAMRDRAA
jgi:prophage regulatory protein